MEKNLNIAYLNGAEGLIRRGASGGGGDNGGGSTPTILSENDVTFYDYDGTVLYSYTKDEFLKLTEMPPLPTREGLICQEWNWTWDETYNYVSKYGICMIGATYTTDDGSTKITIKNKHLIDKLIVIALDVAVGNEVTIDWGDGSDTLTCPEGEWQQHEHYYNKPGDYIITIKPKNGEYTLNWINDGYELVTDANLGENVSLAMTFNSASYLKAISIPKGVELNEEIFYDNVYLKCIVFPSTTKSGTIDQEVNFIDTICIPPAMESLPSYLNTYHITHFCIPNKITEIPNEYFSNGVMTQIVIPDSIQKIGDKALSCGYLKQINLSNHTSVPQLGANAFNKYEPPTIIVPDALYDEWIAATNWSTYATKIIKKSDYESLNN